MKRCAGYFNFTGKSRAEAKDELKAAGLSEKALEKAEGVGK